MDIDTAEDEVQRTATIKAARQYGTGPHSDARLRRIARVSQLIGMRAAVHWRSRVKAKLGSTKVNYIVHLKDCRFLVHVTRGGHSVQLYTVIEVNRGPKGKLHTRIPSYLYLDGKFISEDNYRKWSKNNEF